MVQFSDDRLDATFAALSDATRRGVLERLAHDECSISDLARRFDMTLTGMTKHVGVLERAGLVATRKMGRVRSCRLGHHALMQEAAWIARHRQLWNARFDALDSIIDQMKPMEDDDDKHDR